jgi:hypothetical protein
MRRESAESTAQLQLQRERGWVWVCGCVCTLAEVVVHTLEEESGLVVDVTATCATACGGERWQSHSSVASVPWFEREREKEKGRERETETERERERDKGKESRCDTRVCESEYGSE